MSNTFPGLSNIWEQRHNLAERRASTTLVKAGPLSKYHPSVDIFEKTCRPQDDQTDLAQHWEWEVATAQVRVDPTIPGLSAGD